MGLFHASSTSNFQLKQRILFSALALGCARMKLLVGSRRLVRIAHDSTIALQYVTIS